MSAPRRNVGDIVAACDSGIISIAEARCALRLAEIQAKYNADYSNSSGIYALWTAVAERAHRALVTL